MKNYIQISQGIFKKQGELSVDQRFIKQLYNDADTHPRNRSRILIHENTEAIPQEMIIAFTDKSIVEVSTHIFPESFTLLEGIAKYIFFNSNGDLIGDVMLSSFQNKGVFYCFIPKNTFHRFIPYTKYSLAHEIGFSTFKSEFTTLYLKNQFENISSRSNKEYSLETRNLQLNTEYKLNEKNNFLEVLLTGNVIFFSYQIIEDTRSHNKPTLYKVDSEFPSFLEETIIVLPSQKEFTFSDSEIVKSVSLINGSAEITISNKEYFKFDKTSTCFYTCDNKHQIKRIKNIREELLVMKFISKK